MIYVIMIEIKNYPGGEKTIAKAAALPIPIWFGILFKSTAVAVTSVPPNFNPFDPS